MQDIRYSAQEIPAARKIAFPHTHTVPTHIDPRATYTGTTTAPRAPCIACLHPHARFPASYARSPVLSAPPINIIKKTDEYLAQLSRLEAVIIEIPSVADVRPFRELFTHTGHKHRFRTLREAEMTGALARERQVLPESKDQVVSPFWYLLKYKHQWKYW